MSTFILIHDAWHGAWCWRSVTPLLELAGHTVVAPDLPGSGDDLTPLVAVTLASCVQRVVDLIDIQPPDETLILLGHGLSGMVISQVAEARAERIGLLVYLSGLLPQSGETALQIMQREANPALEECLVVDDLSISLLPEKAWKIFSQESDQQRIDAAQCPLTPQAILPLITPVTLTRRFSHVPRMYLTCRYDLVISPWLQGQMYAASPCEQVIWFMTGHAPFFSAPDRLAARLMGIARLAQKRQVNHV